MVRLLAVSTLVGLLALPVTAAEWAVRPAPAEDGRLPAAAITNDDGHTLYLWPKHGSGTYQIYAELHIDRGEDFGSAMPHYRIDDGAVIDTEAIRQAGEAENALWGHVGDRIAIWRAWSSEEALIQPSDPFRAWLTGQTLRLSYRAADGDTVTTAFPLAGLRDAVTEATGVNAP